MRISYRIILTTFVTLLLIIGASGIAYYSITFNVLTGQQNKHFLQMTNNIVFAYASDIEMCDDVFQSTFSRQPRGNFPVETGSRIRALDFVLLLPPDSAKTPRVLYASPGITPDDTNLTLYGFLAANPQLIVRYHKTRSGVEYLYGFTLRQEYFDSLSARMSTEIAVFLDDSLLFLSNKSTNSTILPEIQKSYKNLRNAKNYSVVNTDLDSLYLFSSIYHARESFSGGNKLSMLIFSTSYETTNLRSTIKYFLGLLFGVSLILSFILSYLFTGKLRKQINSLTRAAELTRRGKLDTRIEVSSNDEIGGLADTFNRMLAALQEQERLKEQYTEFLTYVNRTPNTASVSEAALQKIAEATESTMGALVLLEEGKIVKEFSFGMHEYTEFRIALREIIDKVMHDRKMVRVAAGSTDAHLLSGSVVNGLKDMILLPVIGGEEIIGLLHLAGTKEFSSESIEYVHKISGQLSISLTKAFAYEKLEHFIGELEVQKKRAEESTELKSRFLAIISHELRTPLSSILGLTDLLLSDKSQHEKALERLHIIQRSGRRLLKLINELLELSKIEAGKMSVNKTEFRIAPFMLELEHDFLELASKKGLKLNLISTIHDDAILFCDREKLFQVLANLIGNALKFTQEGSVEVKFELVRENKLAVHVTDTGIGLSAEDRSIIFEEFRQADSTASRLYQGSGLGLSIAKRLVELLHGTISVNSEIGKGSVFSISIPAILSERSPYREKIGETTFNPGIDAIAVFMNCSAELTEIILPAFQYSGFDVINLSHSGSWPEHPELLSPEMVIVELASGTDLSHTEKYLLNGFLKPGSITQTYFITKNIAGTDFEIYRPADFITQFSDHQQLSAQLAELCSASSILSPSDFHCVVRDPSVLSQKAKTFADIPAIVHGKKHIRLFAVLSAVEDFEAFVRNFSGIEAPAWDCLFFVPSDSLLLSGFMDWKFLHKFVRPSSIGIEELPNSGSSHLPGRGERWKITTDEKNAHLPASWQGFEIQDAQKHSVLIVDDDDDSLFTISEYMKESGFSVLTAKNGYECLDQLAHTLPSLVLLDIMMPEMDGFQTIKKIRGKQEWRDLPVLAVTAKAMMNERQTIYRSGFDGLVAKPIVPGLLAYKVMKLLLKGKHNA